MVMVMVMMVGAKYDTAMVRQEGSRTAMLPAARSVTAPCERLVYTVD